MTKKIVNIYHETKVGTKNSSFEGESRSEYRAMVGPTNHGLNKTLKDLASTLNHFSEEGEDVAIINAIHQDVGDIEFKYTNKYFNRPLNDQEMKDLTKLLGFDSQ
ncbi:hypothetical protein ISS08_02390 [Candidatus Pacearchaeota archaeon]|nr:hypothetical protein [Candidatus Pacearchaeota archaeon]